MIPLTEKAFEEMCNVNKACCVFCRMYGPHSSETELIDGLGGMFDFWGAIWSAHRHVRGLS